MCIRIQFDCNIALQLAARQLRRNDRNIIKNQKTLFFFTMHFYIIKIEFTLKSIGK